MPQTPKASFKGLRRASPTLAKIGRSRFDHGEPISKIDMRPMVFVCSLVVGILAIGHFGAPSFAYEVELPEMKAMPVQAIDDRFVVTVTTTRIESGELDWMGTQLIHIGPADARIGLGECRAYLSDGTQIDLEGLHEYGFTLLDKGVASQVGEGFPVVTDGKLTASESAQVDMPMFYIRGDQRMPWRCAGGAIDALERAGYPTIGFLTTPRDALY